MDLFEYNLQKRGTQDAPLAARMRPTTLEEFVGQEQIVGKDKLLYRAIKGDRLGSLIFYGPPGTGKTTLAKIIANTTKSEFVQINATTAGIKDIKDTVTAAKERLGMFGKRPSFLSTKSIVSIKHSRIHFCPMWRMVRWCSLVPQRKILILK